ncbi:MAG: Cys-tRNA(Pro) deacylase [Roseburia sp.]
MGKELKTNAMRILDRNKIAYDVIHYACDEFIDGLHTAKLTGAPVEQSYKTLVMRGKSGQHYVFVIPIAAEVNLKAAARAAGEKSVDLLHVKEITAVTGYVRGGCSPLGMKKQFATIVDQSASAYDTIYISGGRIGTTITLSPADLLKVVRGSYADVVRHT